MFKWLGGLTDSNEKQLKRLQPTVDKINELEPEFEKLSNDELRAKTDEFKARLAEATARVWQQVAEAQHELEEAKQRLACAANELAREEEGTQCKRLQNRAGELEKERHAVENKALNELLPEAFAVVREAAKRNLKQRHFDVQLMGGIVLYQGRIAEMKTGEGKTLVATLPLYLNSLAGRGCHLVTVNDYLARRDPYWMGPIYHALGVTVASIYPMQTPDEHTPARLYDPCYDSGKENDPWRHFRPISRREAYQADIAYGTCAEFGFDYLRDNMVVDLSQRVQGELNYAIVDEVDNLLIDEARTPLIISAPDVEATQKYQVFARLAPRLHCDEDYTVDEKSRTANLTDDGITNVERILGREGLLKSSNLYDPANYSLTRYLENALKAHVLFRRDRDYVVKDGQVIIVDEFTGRLMFGRRYSEGLHQAIEAKEGVKVQRESRTFATVTIQNYFRMYPKLAGMTGTAATEAEEFHKIYKLEVVVLPTNIEYRANQGELQTVTRRDNGVEVTTYENQQTGELFWERTDHPDRVYKNEETKFRAVVNEIEELHKQERPVLIGTVSIEKSEHLRDMLKRRGISCHVLNAKEHTKEAEIIARAGEPGAVTVATNMAGRGVDIVLGGSPDGRSEAEWQEKHDKVVEGGGLHVLGTERHEARRIDNQLRGRSGRQGDPGSSRFYVSLEDDIMKRFGGDRIKGLMEWAGMDENTPIENRFINRSIEGAQVRVEGYHFDMRKHLVEYDDVVNQQREIIYGERKKILKGADLRANILSMVREEIQGAVAARLPDEHGIDWDLGGLLADVGTIFPLPPELNADAFSKLKPKEIEARLIEQAEALYQQREEEMGSANMRVLERLVMLRIIDSLWVEHLTEMEHMRQGIGLMGVAQRDPLVAYKNLGHEQFQFLLSTIRHDVAHTIYHVRIEKKGAPRPAPSPMAQVASGAGSPQSKKKMKVGGRKIGRNDPCPCGSGKKYKHCCGR